MVRRSWVVWGAIAAVIRQAAGQSPDIIIHASQNRLHHSELYAHFNHITHMKEMNTFVIQITLYIRIQPSFFTGCCLQQLGVLGTSQRRRAQHWPVCWPRGFLWNTALACLLTPGLPVEHSTGLSADPGASCGTQHWPVCWPRGFLWNTALACLLTPGLPVEHTAVGPVQTGSPLPFYQVCMTVTDLASVEVRTFFKLLFWKCVSKLHTNQISLMIGNSLIGILWLT